MVHLGTLFIDQLSFNLSKSCKLIIGKNSSTKMWSLHFQTLSSFDVDWWRYQHSQTSKDLNFWILLVGKKKKKDVC